MRKYVVLTILALFVLSSSVQAYIRDANLTKAVDYLGVGYSSSTAPSTFLLNFYGEKKLDDATSIGLLFSRSIGLLGSNAVFEVSVNKLLYGKKNEGFATSGVLGFFAGEIYSHSEHWSNGVLVEESYEPTGQYIYLPELGLAFTYTPNDIFYARANLIFGIQIGFELGYKIMENMEISAALSPVNIIGVKYLL